MATFLIVDDSRLARGIIKQMVEALGHEAIEAANGREGLEMAEIHKPDAITIDLLMPELGGLGFLSTLRKAGNRVPVIVISADIQDEVRRQCEELAARFLNKPIKGPDLAAALSTVLASGRGLS